MTHRAQLLWSGDCPNHDAARRLLRDAVERFAPGTEIEDVDASDPATADRLRFPGSPTIRVDGVDIEPGFREPSDFGPRCRLYRVGDGLTGVPDPAWIERALRS